MAAHRVFISYRRDDAAGYAGRLEEALERHLGPGSVFRDVADLAPGEDFVAAIRARLAGAAAVLVLIGPRWAGVAAGGARRIDDAGDFVRLEVAEALASPAQVVPVLLPGATMPAVADLPDPLKPLARRHALSLGDAHWAADVERLVQALGAPARRRLLRRWPWALGAAMLGAATVVAWWWPAPDPSAALLGTWQAPLRYAWGDRYTEHFEFRRHAGQLTGTASFLGVPRAIERLEFDGTNLHFETRTLQSMGSETREMTHRYSAELQGRAPDQRLLFRLQSGGGFETLPSLAFEARRAPAPASAPR